MENPRITNTIIAALRFYQEEEMAEKTGDTVSEIKATGETLSHEEIELLCNQLTQGAVVHTNAQPTGSKPDGFWTKVVETLEERNSTVKYLAPEKFDDEEHQSHFQESCENADEIAAAAKARLNPNTPTEEILGVLERCQDAVDYYHEREGCEYLKADLEETLAKFAGEGKSLQTEKENLETLREAAAVKALEDENFGEDLTITDQDGWERDGVYWSKKLHGDGPDGREHLSFGVEFAEGSAEVIDTWTQTA